MKFAALRVIAAAFGVVIASLLAACGGGASPPSPPLKPTNGPSGSGTTMNYAQTAVATSTGAAPLYPGFTCTSPQTVRTASAGGAISQTFMSGENFNGRSGLTAVTSSISLRGCADGPESFTETDYYAQTAASGSAPAMVLLVGSTLNYTNYIGMVRSVTVTYASPGLIVGELPLQAGRTWTNSATRALTSVWGANNQETVGVNADGSYTDVSVTVNGIFPYDSTTTIESSDASGSQTSVAGADASAAPSGVSLSAPSGNSVIITPFGTPALPPDAPTPTPCPTAGGTPCPAVTPTPYPQYAWYPYDPSPSRPLESVTSTDKGVTALPASCSTGGGFATSAELVESTDTTLDVWSGTTTTVSDAYIDSHDGVLCLNVTLHHDAYTFGATSADTAPVATETLTFTDSLQNESSPPPLLAAPALSRLGTFWR